MVNMSAKFDKETCNGVVSIVFTRSTDGRTDAHTHTHGTTAALLYPHRNALRGDKNLSCGLGSNKTDNAIDTISKMVPVIDSVVENVDTVVQMKAIQTTHKKREMIGDVNVIINNIKDIHLWQVRLETKRRRSDEVL